MKKIQSMEKWQKASVIVGVVLSITLLINTSLMTYITYQDNFKASIIPTSDTGESLEIDVHGSIGRPSPLRHYLNTVKDWVSTYFVGGAEKTNAQTGITIDIDGANVASTASVDYYIEAVPQTGGSAYRFLEGTSASVTVNGANLDPSNQTTIENHLTAMGLSTDSSHTIDYYVYVQAEATGAISGDTLTSEIARTKFDTVTYQYGTETTLNFIEVRPYDMDGTLYHNEEQDGNFWYTPRSNNFIIGEYQNSADTPVRNNRGVSEYSLSSLPSDPDITDAWIEYTGLDHNTGASNVDIVGYKDTRAPDIDTIAEARALFWEIGNSTEVLLSDDSTFPEIGSGKTIDLDPCAYQYIEDRKSVGWIGLGFRTQGTEDTDPWDDNYHKLSSSEDFDYIYLCVKYLSFSASWYPIGPVSVLAMPLGQALSGVMILAMLGYVAYRAHTEGK